jgi:multidrug efflux pump subunit AcrA (membrane-fusion protein)
MATSTGTTASNRGRLIFVIALLAVAGGVWAASPWWWPLATAWLHPQGAAQTEKAHDDASHGGSETSTLSLSDEARRTLGIEVGTLKPDTYRRIIPVPGRTLTVPGTGRQQVTASASGVIAKVLVSQGDLVAPGQPLFELQLVHAEAIETQVELIDALAKKEVLRAELKRLEELERRTPGAVPGTRLLEKRYELRTLDHLIASRRQMLILLGLPEDDVERLIAIHDHAEGDNPGEDQVNLRRPLLLDNITLRAPAAMGANGQTRFLLEKLNVVTGQHVDSGDVLCQLGDYGTLWIEGQAFERDLEAIRHARDSAWPITVAVERRGQSPLVVKDLRIRDIAPQVDAAAGSVDFYVELPNELLNVPAQGDAPRRVDWKFRPGQRVELRVPTKLIPGVLTVPVAAVAEDGLNHYVFQVSGNTFVRRPVHVLHRDEDNVVIAENRYVTAGVRIALSGAFQLQLALLNKALDPAALAHGHSHG